MDAIKQQRSNSEEVNEAMALLERQHVVLANIVEVLQTGGNGDAISMTAGQLLDELVASILRNLASDGPVRGILAVAALSLASVLGVDLHWGSQLLITGMFAGKEMIEALGAWVRKGKSDKGE
jgi:hypothetical protein